MPIISMLIFMCANILVETLGLSLFVPKCIVYPLEIKSSTTKCHLLSLLLLSFPAKYMFLASISKRFP